MQGIWLIGTVKWSTLDLVKLSVQTRISKQDRWVFPNWVEELHQIAAYIREVQHENSDGLTNVNWTPDFVCMANGDHAAQGGV